MEKMYEVEVEKIRIKYEKVIGLTEISDIFMTGIIDTGMLIESISDLIEESKRHSIKSFCLDEMISGYNKQKDFSYFNTSNIYKFRNLKITIIQKPEFIKKNINNTYVFDVCVVWFKDGHTVLVKESAEEVKKLWEEK